MPATSTPSHDSSGREHRPNRDTPATAAPSCHFTTMVRPKTRREKGKKHTGYRCSCSEKIDGANSQRREPASEKAVSRWPNVRTANHLHANSTQRSEPEVHGRRQCRPDDRKRPRHVLFNARKRTWSTAGGRWTGTSHGSRPSLPPHCGAAAGHISLQYPFYSCLFPEDCIRYRFSPDYLV